MRKVFALALAAFACATFPALAGEATDPSTDKLRALIKTIPPLAVERVEIKVDPPMKLEGISSIAADKNGNMYVLHRPTAPDGDPVVMLDRNGKFLRSWGRGMYKTPHGIRIDAAGNVWTVDANTSDVYKFTADGKKLLEIKVGGIPDPKREFCGATDVAFGPNGHVYIGDGYCNGRVLEYTADGKKVKEWGKRGTGPGEFNNVHGIALGPDGNLYVADRENGRLQWFDINGKFLGERQFGGQFYNITFDAAGNMYAATHSKGVSLDEEFNLLKFDFKTGKILGKIEVRSHEVGVGADGTLMPATRSELLVVYRQK
jgi:DNA-binding beta-propeller fold protein YncE